MAAIDSLIDMIEDFDLRSRIKAEVHRIQKKRKFGLVYEEHLPEATLLYDVPIKKGTQVTLNADGINGYYRVLKVDGNNVTCVRLDDTHKEETFSKDKLVAVAQFGETIYPYLKPIDSICNAPDSELWHTLIEADNFHALQLLSYLYEGKVDCIYIDPPYNTGARDWKYNNDYVDGVDAYRHSKWLSMMERRLRLAKKLLNPKNSVLIVTIDEKEYLHLGCLLEQLFPEGRMQMVSSVVNHAGTSRNTEFSRINEYIFTVMFGDASIEPLVVNEDRKESVLWDSLRRHNPNNIRDKQHPNQFYPIYINIKTNKIDKIGKPLPFGMDKSTAPEIKGCVTVFPIRDDGTEMMWGVMPSELERRLNGGYVRVGKYSPNKPQQYSIQFLSKGTIEDIKNGIAKVSGYAKDGSILAYYPGGKKMMPTNQWDIASHDARDYGTKMIRAIFNDLPFSFPKSLYAVHDIIRFFVLNKPNALILDFFAGSGTTLHAVNLLNAEDGGNRRCIMVTNNEVSEEESKKLKAKGLKPNDPEWEALGIAHYVTWARTRCSILGKDINDKPLKGEYLDTELSMSDGFKSNVSFFKLGFLEKAQVSLGRKLSELLPVLWMKAGAKGVCPTLVGEPDYIILPENHFAVLINDYAFAAFAKELESISGIEVVFINTDSEDGYREMISKLNIDNTYQLFRDYLDNFTINYAG